jgi:ABC-type branched-subunit amino acid transport system substrate-binding protein
MALRSKIISLTWSGFLILAGAFLGSAVLVLEAKAEPIKVGAPIPITGPFASDGFVMEKAEKLAIAELNAQGGLLGREIEMIVFDIGDLTPDKLQAAAVNLVERENVNVLINGYGGMGPDIPAFCPYDVPYLHVDGPAYVVRLWTQMKCGNIFMFIDTAENFGGITFDLMMKMGHEFPNKNLAVIEGPFDWEFEMTGSAMEAAKAAGWEVVLWEKVDYGISEWGPILTKLHDANPSLIYSEFLDPAAVNALVDQFNTNPVKDALLYVGYNGAVPAFNEVVKRGIADGVLGMTPSAHRPDEKGRIFVEKWRNAYNEDPSLGIAAEIYDQVMFWAAAVEKVGSVDDYAAINEALRTMSFDGVTGVLKFNDEQYINSTDEVAPVQILQVQDSKVVPIMIGSKIVADFVKPAWME